MITKIIFQLNVLLILLFTTSLLSYDVGDYAENINFEDINWGTNNIPEYSQKSLSDLALEGKTVIIYFFDITYA